MGNFAEAKFAKAKFVQDNFAKVMFAKTKFAKSKFAKPACAKVGFAKAKFAEAEFAQAKLATAKLAEAKSSNAKFMIENHGKLQLGSCWDNLSISNCLLEPMFDAMIMKLSNRRYCTCSPTYFEKVQSSTHETACRWKVVCLIEPYLL